MKPCSLMAPVAIALAFSSAASASAFRAPAPDSPNVPTNTLLWISEARTRPLQTATLRDAAGTSVSLARETLDLGAHTLYRLRPEPELKGYSTYSLELQFLDGPPEMLSLLTGAGRESTPPPPGLPFEAHFGTQQPGHDGSGCPQTVYPYAYLTGKPSPGAALYLLEHSLTDSQYTVVLASRTPEFTRTQSGWYRIRPVSLANLAPSDSALASRQVTVPAPYKPSCARPADDDEALGCAASAPSPAAAAPLTLALALLLGHLRRRATSCAPCGR